MLKNNLYNKAYLNIINESAYVDKCRQIAREIGGEYIPETNTIDCKGNEFRFKNSWLDENGTFNFKLINTSDNWGSMFFNCFITHLPDSFTIPESITKCGGMFFGCDSLTHLPDNFTIPQGITDCRHMFNHCESLTHLPDNFTISQSVVDCNGMFFSCKSLTHLPDSFTVPQSVVNCYDMFNECTSLTDLPDGFTIPNSVTDCSWMFKNCKSLKHLSNSFTIPMDCYCEGIFYKCDKLDIQDPEAYQQWEL